MVRYISNDVRSSVDSRSSCVRRDGRNSGDGRSSGGTKSSGDGTSSGDVWEVMVGELRIGEVGMIGLCIGSFTLLSMLLLMLGRFSGGP